jgi:HlyD family secretion protein
VPKTDQNVVSYEVLLSVDNGELLLKPGMTASVEIVTAEFKDVLIVPNKALRFSPPKASQFRGPPGGGVPLLRKAQSSKDNAADAGDPVKKLGRIGGNEGILWIPAKTPLGEANPVKVEKIATDGILTAIQSTDIREGDAIIVEQADPGRQSP